MLRRRTRDSVLSEANAYLEDANESEENAEHYHERAVIFDKMLTEEYTRPWRDDLTIEQLKRDRDFQLIQADQWRRRHKKAYRKHVRLMRRARWMK